MKEYRRENVSCKGGYGRDKGGLMWLGGTIYWSISRNDVARELTPESHDLYCTHFIAIDPIFAFAHHKHTLSLE